jgi:hypothetical protein
MMSQTQQRTPATAMDFRVRFGINDVEHDQQHLSQLSVSIQQFIKTQLMDKYNISSLWRDIPSFVDRHHNPDADADSDYEFELESKTRPQSGVAFAISKITPNFMEHLPNSQFRYRHDEVLGILKDTSTRFDLSGFVRYNRDHGVFVYNLYY